MMHDHATHWWMYVALAALAGLLAGGSVAVRTPAAAQGQPGAADPIAPAVGAPGVARDPAGQPIAFSHAHHVGQYQIDCQFCHAYARRGPVAGIPSVERCVGCHRQILSDRPEILRVLAYWESEEPIPWIRVHDLPDYVRFTHKAHVRAGVDCATCHGDVARMEIAQQVQPLSMGWCLDCHKARDASRDCLVCHY